MVINPDSMYYGGYFKAQMTFPKDYPYKPPGPTADMVKHRQVLTAF
jgi:ubiquitin-protein ligase